MFERSKYTAAAGVAVALAMGLSGCGSSGSPAAQASGSGPAAPASATDTAGTTASAIALPSSSAPAVVSSSSTTAQSGTNPSLINAAAWLTIAQLPFESTAHWAQSQATAMVKGAEQNLGTCLTGNPADFGAGNTWQTGNVTGDTVSGAGKVTLQTYGAQLFYSSAAAARKGLTTIEADYAKCQGDGTPGLVDTVKTTASTSWGVAVLRTVRTSTGSPASSDTVASDNHEYVVEDGEVLYFLGVYGTAAIDGTTQDAAILQAMDTALANYGS